MLSFFSADYTINLDIKNRKPAYLGNDEIEGVVYFDVKKDGLSYNEIRLVLLGKYPILPFAICRYYGYTS